MSKLLTTASAVLLLAAGSAYAHDTARYNDNEQNQRVYNAGGNAAIQKGESASTKAYGYNKQGDHYSTANVRAGDRWDEAYTYPGSRPAYGAKQAIVIKKGGSGISDSAANAHANEMRPYGSYWN